MEIEQAKEWDSDGSAYSCFAENATILEADPLAVYSKHQSQTSPNALNAVGIKGTVGADKRYSLDK